MRVVVEIGAGQSRKPAHMYKCSNCFHSHFSSSSLSLSQSQTLRQTEVKQLKRPKGSCQTVSCRLHANLLLLFCYHVDICAWLCRGTHVDQSSLYDPFVDMWCTLLLLFILLSLPVSLLFFFALYFSPRPCVRLLLHECSRGCPFMLRSSEGPKKRRILCNAEIWVSSYFAGIIFLGSHDNNSSWVKEACYTWENSLFVVTAL